ncbi:MAG: hypothetical protein KDK34_11935, partial [Leptospiraceae bacterium]|nr:hypothetical protein [Leptospiraceae bacterium]
MQTILFFSRLILFYLVILIPFFMDPAVAVAYDFSGKVAWLFLLPAQMLIAYFIRPPRTRRIWMGPAIALGLLAFIVLFFSDFEWQAVLLFTVVSLFAYISTRMVFSGKGPGFAVLEMFFIGLVYFKLLNFTRSAPDIAEASGAAIKIVLILAVLSFLLHAIILYLAAFPDRSRKRKRAELVIFSVIAVLLLFPLAVLLPDNFVDHEAILNNLREEPPPRSRE